MKSSTIFVYVRSLDGSLGGPLFSSLDLFRLLEGEVDIRILSLGSAESNRVRLAELSVPFDCYISVWDFLRLKATSSSRILHLQHVFYPMTAFLMNFARIKGYTTVLSPRGALDAWSMDRKRLKKRAGKALFARALWRRADVIHCTAVEECEQVEALLPGVKTSLAANVISSVWDSQPCQTEVVPSALFLSRLHEKKRPDLAIMGLAELLRSGAVSTLTVAGPGPPDVMRSLRSLVEDMELTEHVNFVGELTESECLAAYQRHEMLVLPTSQENFGRVLFEALGCGLAVFVPNHVDTWPELRSLGAFHIDQTKESIADEVGRYASLPLEERRAEVLRRAHAASKFLSRERLIAAYSDLYSQGSRRS